jgi:hypothetical protein
MKIPIALLLGALLSACSVFGPENLGPGAATRDQLWRQGHAAMHADSFRIAMAAFQRLSAEHPRDEEGREARFYLGTLYLEPDNPAYDAALAAQNLELYLAADTAGGRVTRRPEAQTLLALSRQLALPCEQRTGDLRCASGRGGAGDGRRHGGGAPGERPERGGGAPAPRAQRARCDHPAAARGAAADPEHAGATALTAVRKCESAKVRK